MVAVSRQGKNTLNLRRVPIIFVPGVMGTRLHFPAVNEDWDPDSKWAMLHWLRISADQARKEMAFSATATIINTNDDLTKLQIMRGWAGVVASFYVPFLQHLEGLKLCAHTPVWAVGYDWRQSNRDSGTFLDKEITRILHKEEAEEFVLISHSMGGIVCRSCLHADSAGNAGKLQGVIHVVQPARGAAVFYRRMYTGAIKKFDGGWGLAKIQGTTPVEFATLLSVLRGPCELIPNNDYRDVKGVDWLWDDRSTPHTAWTSPMFRWYGDPGGPPGVWWSLAPKSAPAGAAAQLKLRMTESDAFHTWLGTYKHPETWSIYSTGLETDMAARFATPKKGDKNRGIQIQRRNQGDATVPETSGSALFSTAETSTDTTGAIFMIDPSMRQFRVTGVEHAAAFNNGLVRTVIEKMLLVALGCVRPAPPDTGKSQSERVA